MNRRPIPPTVLSWLRAGAILLVVSAAVGNVGHTFTHVHERGQEVWYAVALAVTPDVGVLIGVTLVTFRRRSVAAWSIIVASAAFVSWAAVSVAGTDPRDRVVALAPVGFAALAAFLLESIRSESGEPVEVTFAHAEALGEDAARTARADAEVAHAEAQRERTQREVETARAASLEAELATARQAHAEPARTRTPEPSRGRTRSARPAPAKGAHADSDLQRRARVRAEYEAARAAGTPLETAELARRLFAVDTPDGKQLAAARAAVSRWRAAAESTPGEAAL